MTSLQTINNTLFLLEFTLKVSYSLLNLVGVVKLWWFAAKLLCYGCSGVAQIIFLTLLLEDCDKQQEIFKRQLNLQ